jgi:hypothetical protein
MKLKQIIAIDHHRNGVGGSPFDVVVFRDSDEPRRWKVAILFEPQSCCAVLDVHKLAAGDIAFGSNSWRGDQYEPLLRQAINEHRQQQSEEDCHYAESEIDIQQLLRQRRQVAVVWCVEDVKHVRPDLTEDQAWQVLQQCYDKHDCEWGFTWTYLQDVAADLFPKQPSTKE